MTTRMLPLIAAAMLLPLAACDGPKEKAGRDADKAQAAAAGLNYSGEGPNQRMGEAQDKADRARQQAQDAAAEALEKQGDEIKRQADLAAQKLEEQAKTVRDAGKPAGQ